MKTYNLKVAMIITSLEVGGAEKMVIDLASKLQEEIEIRLYIIRKNYHSIYDDLAKNLGIKVIYLNNQWRVFNVFTAWKLKQHLEKFQPDVIHTHLKSSSYIYFYNLTRHNFLWIHTVHTYFKIDIKILRRILMESLIIRKRIKLVAVSPVVNNSIKNKYPKLNPLTINNGVDSSRFKFSKRDYSKINIIHVGRFVGIKNHVYLIREFAELVKVYPDSLLTLVGDGPLMDKIKKLVHKLKITDNVIFVGNTSQVERYLSAANLFVLPSKYEGLSLSLIEAMATGLIAITGAGGIDIIKNGVNGYLIELTENMLVTAIINIFKEKDKLYTIQQQAYQTAKEYSLEKMKSSYLSLYLGAIND